MPTIELLSTGHAAAFLGIGKIKLLALIRAERIPSKMLDDRIRIAIAFAGSLPAYSPGKAVRP